VTASFSRQPTSRADWRAHVTILRVFNTVVAIGSVWMLAVNLAFYSAVAREFAPELLATIGRVLVRGG
jgi:hypothetical protein